MNVRIVDCVVLVAALAGCMAAAATALVHRQALGAWQLAVYAACGAAAVAVVWLWRRRVPFDLDRLRRDIRLREKAVRREQRQLQQAMERAEQELRRQLHYIDRREQALANKLIAYYETEQFPRAVDLSQREPDGEDISELAAKDRQLLALLQEESKRLFDRIKNNEYAVEGRFDPRLLRDDLYDLMHRVARIYRPDAEQPLLETSVGQVLAATSRLCLHFLAILDTLPLGMKDRSFSSIYGYVRQAVLAYGVYSAAAPYLPYLGMASSIGRMAMGANPLAMTTWWVAGQLAGRAVKATATRLVNRQALWLLHELVRAVGFEVAAVYGHGFRQRDPNWIYAAELSELLVRCRPAHQTLQNALSELSVLQLRSEYDRLFLYRLLAEGRSAEPHRWQAQTVLTTAERQAIAERLERFAESCVFWKTEQDAQQWRSEVEQRLGVRLKLDATTATQWQWPLLDAALRSLAGFLIDCKLLETGEIAPLLRDTQVGRQLSDEQWDEWIGSFGQSPAASCEPPNLPPDSPMARQFFEDLCRLAAARPPYGGPVDELVLRWAAFLRIGQRKAQAVLDGAYQARLQQQLAGAAAPSRIGPDAARALLNLLEGQSPPRLLYDGVAVQPELPDGTKSDLWLIGLDQLLLLQVGPAPQIVWRGGSDVRVARATRFLDRSCRLTGGQWLIETAGDAARTIVVRAPLMSKYDAYFAPLFQFCAGPVERSSFAASDGETAR